MKSFLCFVLLSGTLSICAQQLGDKTYEPDINDPLYEAGAGPIVLVDAAHNNFHTIEGRYGAFAKVLTADGYVVRSFDQEFSEASLDSIDCLVISNAINEKNAKNWHPPHLSAFSGSEIIALHQWVLNGGRLFLIADHQPFPGAARDLAAAFDIEFNNGFAMLDDGSDQAATQYTVFSKTSGSLKEHTITRGIDSIRTFVGQGFRSPEAYDPIIVFPAGFRTLMPEIPWQFDDDTKKYDIRGWYQGVVGEPGDGKIAVFGEAAMFTAQKQNDQFVMGLAAKGAEQNQQFLRNIIEWLTEDL